MDKASCCVAEASFSVVTQDVEAEQYAVWIKPAVLQRSSCSVVSPRLSTIVVAVCSPPS